MKRRNGPFYVLAALLISCGHHNGKTSISVKDKSKYFEMSAHYQKNRTKAVDEFLQDKIGKLPNSSMFKRYSNTEMVLEDGTRFYLEKSPGYLSIELDKSKNSTRSYMAVKQLCEALKPVIFR